MKNAQKRTPEFNAAYAAFLADVVVLDPQSEEELGFLRLSPGMFEGHEIAFETMDAALDKQARAGGLNEKLSALFRAAVDGDDLESAKTQLTHFIQDARYDINDPAQDGVPGLVDKFAEAAINHASPLGLSRATVVAGPAGAGLDSGPPVA